MITYLPFVNILSVLNNRIIAYLSVFKIKNVWNSNFFSI